MGGQRLPSPPPLVSLWLPLLRVRDGVAHDVRDVGIG
jgi:hypothetical protein